MMRTALLVVCGFGALGVACASPTEVQEERVSNDSKIVGGTTAQLTAWPGTAYLEVQGGQFCGATLVADQWVITASHCIGVAGGRVGGIDNVVIGRQNTNGAGGEVIPVAQVIKHEGFDDQTMNNDIALVKLSRASTQAKAHIVGSEEWKQLAKTGAPATVVGWGVTSEGGQQSPDLRQVGVSLVASAQCNTSYQNSLTQNMVCAGVQGGGKDACQGDSGGPLYMAVNNVPVQVGVVSFGQGCAQANFPGVYTRVANYIGWLTEKTNGAVGASPVIEQPEQKPSDTGEEDSSSTTSKDGEDTSSNDSSSNGKETPQKRARPVTQSAGCAVSTQGSTSTSRLGILFALVAVGALSRRRSRATKA
jgi:trypsin